MSINIWGSTGKTSNDTSSLSNTIASFVRKSGDFMRGVLNMGNNRVANIGDPVNETDAVNRKYTDNNLIHRGGDNDVDDTLRFGTIEDKNVEIIKGNESYISLGNNYININRKLLLNLREPVGDSEAVSKRFFDNNAVHKGGERGMPDHLQIGTLDEKHVELIRNGTPYILLDNDIETYRTINVNRKQIKNLRDPVNDKEAVHKQYVDLKHNELSELISKNDEGDVFLKWGTDSYISLQNNVVNLEKDLYLNNNARIHNLPDPIGALEATNKRYVDTTTVRRGGNWGVVGGLHIGTRDNVPVFLISNSEIYITLINNFIDARHHQIVNVPEPTNERDATNKKYVDDEMVRARSYIDEHKITKCYIGYIPSSPNLNGFTITASSELDRARNIMNAFNNSSLLWVSRPGHEHRISIKCPEPIRIWAYALNGHVEDTVDIVLEGSNNGQTYTYITDISTQLTDEFQKFPIIIPNTISYQYYNIKFTVVQTKSISLRRFQIYVYND